MAPPSDKRLAWLRMLEAHTRLVALMERDLRRDCGVPLAWYDVLIKVWLPATGSGWPSWPNRFFSAAAGSPDAWYSSRTQVW